jgi:hypothetical protein
MLFSLDRAPSHELAWEGQMKNLPSTARVTVLGGAAATG